MKQLLRLVMSRVREWTRESDIPLHMRYPQYKIGLHTYGGLVVRDCGEGASLTIGNYTSIAEGVKVFTGCEHRPDWVTTYPFNVLWPEAIHLTGHPKTKGDVIIGNDVWIGTEAIILSGVSVGDGAIIGARAVVARDVPAYSIIAGNPAKVVRYRFEDKVINRLLDVKWWDWNESQLKMAMADLLSDDMEQFLNKAEQGLYQ